MTCCRLFWMGDHCGGWAAFTVDLFASSGHDQLPAHGRFRGMAMMRYLLWSKGSSLQWAFTMASNVLDLIS